MNECMNCELINFVQDLFFQRYHEIKLVCRMSYGR